MLIFVIARSPEGRKQRNACHQCAAGGNKVFRPLVHGDMMVCGAQQKSVGIHIHRGNMFHQRAELSLPQLLLPGKEVIALALLSVYISLVALIPISIVNANC